MNVEKVFFQSDGQKISGVLHLPEQNSPPCVVASHGLLSSKDSEKYIALGERLSREGIAMLRFDFRGIGESEGRLEDDTVSRRIADLGAAIDFVLSRAGLGKKIGLVGSSLGGYVSLFKAAADREVGPLSSGPPPFISMISGQRNRRTIPPFPGRHSLRTFPGIACSRSYPRFQTAW